MPVIFKEDGHIYESLNEDLEKDKIKWTSVTSFISKFKPKFDSDAISKISSPEHSPSSINLTKS